MITKELDVHQDLLIEAITRYKAAEKACDDAQAELKKAARMLREATDQIGFPHPDRLNFLSKIEDGK